jgi:hypothetical protein
LGHQSYVEEGVQAHCRKEDNDAKNMRIPAWVWIDSNYHAEEEKSDQDEVDIHYEVTRMILHEITEEVREVKNKERTVKER